MPLYNEDIFLGLIFWLSVWINFGLWVDWIFGELVVEDFRWLVYWIILLVCSLNNFIGWFLFKIIIEMIILLKNVMEWYWLMGSLKCLFMNCLLMSCFRIIFVDSWLGDCLIFFCDYGLWVVWIFLCVGVRLAGCSILGGWACPT